MHSSTGRALLLGGLFLSILFSMSPRLATVRGQDRVPAVVLNRKDNGYRGIWYSNQPSHDQGETWLRERQLTSGSLRNHTYVRRPVGAHPDFYAFWADGHGRRPSRSRLYFANRQGEVRGLPRVMRAEFEIPPLLPTVE